MRSIQKASGDRAMELEREIHGLIEDYLEGLVPGDARGVDHFVRSMLPGFLVVSYRRTGSLEQCQISIPTSVVDDP